MVRRIVLLFTVAAVMAAMMALAGPALADHQHYLKTEGITVEDIASGQTEKCASEPGGHKFHENMHKGQPEEAFAIQGKVFVGKSEDATC